MTFGRGSGAEHQVFVLHMLLLVPPCGAHRITCATFSRMLAAHSGPIASARPCDVAMATTVVVAACQTSDASWYGITYLCHVWRASRMDNRLISWLRRQSRYIVNRPSPPGSPKPPKRPQRRENLYQNGWVPKFTTNGGHQGGVGSRPSLPANKLVPNKLQTRRKGIIPRSKVGNASASLAPKNEKTSKQAGKRA